MAKVSRLARLIDLVPYISQHQGISIENLAAKFKVSKAEIEKDLWLLYMCGLPGHTPLELMEFEFEDGYVTVRNAEELKSPRSLTQTEISTLVIGLSILEEQGSTAAGKLKAKLADKLNTPISFKPSGIYKFLNEIEQAIRNNKVLKINYAGTVREVIPFEVYYEAENSYLRAYCKRAKDRRTFKVSRINTLEISAISELAPNVVPSDSHLQNAQIKVHHNARRVRESLGGKEDIQYFSTEWLISEVMALGGAVELLDPKLRAEIKERAQTSQKLYLG